MPTLKLSPAGLELAVASGTRLQDILFAQGVEFPCGGRGRCKGCRVKVLRGNLPVRVEEINLLTPDEIETGWRLSCCHSLTGDLELELAQWEAAILSDQTSFRFVPRTGLGIAIDLGTTTIAAQLLDLATGNVLAVQTALNAQARHGGDVMSRVEFAMSGGQLELQRVVRDQLGEMVARLLAASLRFKIESNRHCRQHRDASLVLRSQPRADGRQSVSTGTAGAIDFLATRSGLGVVGKRGIEFLPCLGGFVGSDILAGIVATGLHESRDLVALMDLGTNGEVVVGNREKMLCTSTAAGPAFEGARISQGMRAATGAISEVRVEDGFLSCRVIGGGEARGLCGSGLVDAVAAGLELEWIHPSGRMANGREMPLAGNVSIAPI